jgi:D-serine deaminase-like pyridoxal phosphate-dependent protein
MEDRTLKVEEIETPALLIDLDLMEKNLRTMREWLADKKVKLRAHFKTPKTPIIAWKEIEYGAMGVCAQKLGEAEVLVQAGIKDILITNQIVDPAKIERMMNLQKHARIQVIIDNPLNAKCLSETALSKNTRLDVLVEVDVGGRRCGVRPGEATADLVKQISGMPGVEFRGLQCYAGYLQMAEHRIGFEKKMEELGKVAERIHVTKDTVEDAGFSIETISGAGTGTHRYEYQHYDEIQAGSYVLMDARYKPCAPWFEIALTILATVTSTPEPGRVVLDAGGKSVSTDYGPPSPKNLQNAKCTIPSDEHGMIHFQESEHRFRIGQKVELYPSHLDTTINLHDKFYAIRDGEVEAVWPVLARGKFV